MLNDSVLADEEATLQDVVRRHRTVDMMMSMHSGLRDKYSRWATALDLVIFAGSTILSATVLLDPQIVAFLGGSDAGARIILGVVSITMFFLSILALRVNWKEKTGKHQRAVAILADLKARGRLLGSKPNPVSVAGYERLYDFAMGGLEPVPEREFLSLKAQHRRKVAVSKALDRFPNASVWLLLLKWRLADSLAAWKERTVDAPTKD